MAILEVGPDRRHQRLEDLGLLELAQESQSASAHVLVRVVQIIAEVRAGSHINEGESHLAYDAQWRTTEGGCAY